MIIAGEHFYARYGNRGSGDRGTEIRYCPTSIDGGGEEIIYPFYLYLGGGNTLPHFTVQTGINSTFALTTSSLSKIVFLPPIHLQSQF
jgi:hypothetical protein